MKNGEPTKPLAEVCEFRNGLWKGKKPPYIHVGVIRNTNFNRDGTLDDSDIAFHDVEVKQFKTRQLEFGDIILEKSGGGPKQPVGRVITFEKQNGKYSFSNFTSIVRVSDPNKLDYRYLHRVLFWYYTSGVTEGMQRRSTGIRNLDFNAYKQLEIPHPPLPEQRRIVGILDEAFAGIATAKATAEKNLRNARALFESHLNAVFTQRGDDWVEFRLADAVQSLHQGLNTAGQKVKFYESGYPIIQTRNIDDEGVVEIDTKIKLMCEDDWLLYKDKYRPAVGDVFFTNIGTIGKTAIVTVDRDYLIHWNIFKLRPHHETITSAFLKYTLDHLTSSGYFKKLQKGGTVDFVTKKMISEALVHLPNTAEQTGVVAKLDALNEETLRLESIYQRKLAALDELKKSLLHQAFSGQL